MSGAAPTRSIARRVLLHPLLWAVVCFAAALPLLGTEHDFWGFLLALLGAALGLLLFALATGQWAGPADDAPEPMLRARTALGFAAAPAAGWVWLSLIGRVTGAVQEDSSRRAALLREPEWLRDAAGWSLGLAVVPLRRGAFRTIVGGLSVLGAGVLSAFVIVFDDLAQRMSPMVMLVVLGWAIGMPAYLVLRAIARSRTITVSLRIDDERMRVLRVDDGAPVLDAPLAELRALRWSARSAPTRLELRTVDADLVLLVGMARRPRGTAATLPEPPVPLLRALADAGLMAEPTRRARDGELRLVRV